MDSKSMLFCGRESLLFCRQEVIRNDFANRKSVLFPGQRVKLFCGQDLCTECQSGFVDRVNTILWTGRRYWVVGRKRTLFCGEKMNAFGRNVGQTKDRSLIWHLLSGLAGRETITRFSFDIDLFCNTF